MTGADDLVRRARRQRRRRRPSTALHTNGDLDSPGCALAPYSKPSSGNEAIEELKIANENQKSLASRAQCG